ncbi:MAG: PaaI family thioesterase [Spirochaetales bacterium]|nr:PaaI family thioesterase [Spirochaetales bacterium]
MNTCGKYLPTYKGCFVCGDSSVNPHTLHLKFCITNEGVETEFLADEKQEGYRGIVHGGIISSLLDETIGWAVAVARKKYFMTVELNVQFLKTLPVRKKVIVKGKIVTHKRRSAQGEGMMIDQEGIIYARASARFFLMQNDEAQIVHNYLTFHKDDIDILGPE